jgi:hypothetical protein
VQVAGDGGAEQRVLLPVRAAWGQPADAVEDEEEMRSRMKRNCV